jgi:hypothetical protein
MPTQQLPHLRPYLPLRECLLLDPNLLMEGIPGQVYTSGHSIGLHRRGIRGPERETHLAIIQEYQLREHRDLSLRPMLLLQHTRIPRRRYHNLVLFMKCQQDNHRIYLPSKLCHLSQPQIYRAGLCLRGDDRRVQGCRLLLQDRIQSRCMSRCNHGLGREEG